VSSDVDVVAAGDPLDVVHRLRRDMTTSRAAPLVLWNYDANSWTSFWFTPDLRGGVQLDVLGDPRGHGKYGLRTDVALRRRERGERYFVLDEVSACVYQLSKRTRKRDGARTAREVERARRLGLVRSDISLLLSGDSCRQVLSVAGLAPFTPGDGAGTVARRARRLARRVTRVRPIGLAAVVSHGSSQEQVARLRSQVGDVLLDCREYDARAPLDLLRTHTAIRRAAVAVVRMDDGRRAWLPAGSVIDLRHATGDLSREFYARAVETFDRRWGR
jgi:hypothetical protein